MKTLWMVPFLLVGCANVSIPLTQAEGHVTNARRTLRTSGTISTLDREKVDWSLARADRALKAAIIHKGMPPMPPIIPEGSWDIGRIRDEDELMENYKLDVEREQAIRAVVSGWFGKTLGAGVGGGSLLAVILGLLRDRKKKRITITQQDQAIGEFNDAIETLPKAKRVELGKDRKAMSGAHKSLG